MALRLYGDGNIENVTSINTSVSATELAYLNGVTSNIQSQLASAGKILQVDQAVKTDVWTTTSTAYVAVPGLSVSITPASTSSRILIFGNIYIGMTTTAAYSMFGRLVRDSNPIFIADADGSRDRGTFSYQSGGAEGPFAQGIAYIDSPATTSSVTYGVQIRAESPQTMYINRGYEADGNSGITPRVASSLMVMEIAA